MIHHSNRITAVTRITGFVFAALFLAVAGAHAQSFCFDEAGSQYGINPIILRAIAKVESNFNPRAINRNRNGTYDFGVMQINSNWAYTLGFDRWSTLGDACANIKTGAMILSGCMKKYGYTWEAIGCYNSQTPDKRDRYAQVVFRQLQRIEKEDGEARKNLEAMLQGRIDALVAANLDGQGGESNPATPESVPAPPETAQEQPVTPLTEQLTPQDIRDAEITVSSFQEGIAKGL